jgi:hypothetical protein
MNKRAAVRLWLGSGLALLLAACGQSGPSSEVDPYAGGASYPWAYTAPEGQVTTLSLTPGENNLFYEPILEAQNSWGPVEIDRSNGERAAGDGKTLTLNGKTYRRGFGVHAYSKLLFSLKGTGATCTRFTADIGVDDEVGNRGSVVFKVYLDGTEVYSSGTMTGASATKKVDLNITGKQKLLLEVTDAGNGISYDHADWAIPRVYCQKEGTTPPPPGTDIVVFNDVNIFLDDAQIASDPENQKMFRNLVNYSTSGLRGSAKEVWVDTGHGGNDCQGFCPVSQFAAFDAAVTAASYTVVHKNTAVGDLNTLPASVKVLMLVNPLAAYAKTEINAMKQFAAEGGRVVFIGEHSGFYGAGIPIENDFLKKMGAVMENIGNAVDCGKNVLPASSLRAAQITTGLNSLTMACSSVIQPGPQDFIFLFDSTNTLALAGVARIDTTPLP